MNTVAVVNLVAGLVSILIALPLIRGRIKRNPWYGIRIPAAFESDERWYAINRYGGRLFLRWGIWVVLVALSGFPLPRPWWVVYDLASAVPILGGLVLVLSYINRYARITAPVRPSGSKTAAADGSVRSE